MRLWFLALIVACQPRALTAIPDSSSPATLAPTADVQTSPAPASTVCFVNGLYHLPNPAWTPGAICTEQDPNFDGFRYPGHVAHCGRNIAMSEKNEVARLYGIPATDYKKYEFDHFIPLNAGGSNDAKNLWPQPLDEAKLKDVVEDEVYNGLKKGTMTQDVAVTKIREWRPSICN